MSTQLHSLFSPFFVVYAKNSCVFDVSSMSERFISCKATFINDDVIELPIGREFLSKPVKARGEWFVTFYFGWHHQVELVKIVDMKDLRDFKD